MRKWEISNSCHSYGDRRSECESELETISCVSIERTLLKFMGSKENSKEVSQEGRAVGQGWSLPMPVDIRTGKGNF